jgi:hypothetical protein
VFALFSLFSISLSGEGVVMKKVHKGSLAV